MKEKIEKLTNFLETKLPDLKEVIDNSDSKDILIHQDAFAADYQDDEYVLLGSVIKYAGLKGITITFHGINRETL